MEQNAFWGASSSSASPEIHRILLDPQVDYCVSKYLPFAITWVVSNKSSYFEVLWNISCHMDFCSDELLAPGPTLKLEYHTLLAVIECLYCSILPGSKHSPILSGNGFWQRCSQIFQLYQIWQLAVCCMTMKFSIKHETKKWEAGSHQVW